MPPDICRFTWFIVFKKDDTQCGPGSPEGVSQFVNGPPAGIVSSDVSSEPFYLLGSRVGAYNDRNAGFYGRIAEILVYDDSLKNEEHSAIEVNLGY